MSENSTTLVRHVDYDGYVLRFGFGKIRVGVVTQEDSTVGVILNPMTNTLSIGDTEPSGDGDARLDPGGALLLFDKVESIDVVIETLRTARENMVRDGFAEKESDDGTTA